MRRWEMRQSKLRRTKVARAGSFLVSLGYKPEQLLLLILQSDDCSRRDEGLLGGVNGRHLGSCEDPGDMCPWG